MRFRSRTENKVRIATTEGHVLLVGPEWRDIPEKFHSLAWAAGCVSEDMVNLTPPPAPAAISVENVIAAIKMMLEEGKESNFTKAGLPDRSVLNAKVGVKVEKAMVEQAWEKIQAEASETEETGKSVSGDEDAD